MMNMDNTEQDVFPACSRRWNTEVLKHDKQNQIATLFSVYLETYTDNHFLRCDKTKRITSRNGH